MYPRATHTTPHPLSGLCTVPGSTYVRRSLYAHQTGHRPPSSPLSHSSSNHDLDFLGWCTPPALKLEYIDASLVPGLRPLFISTA